MSQINVKIVGVTPMLQNRMTAEQLESIRTKDKKKFKAPADPREEAERKAYLNQQTGEPYLPVENLMSCLIEAGKFIRLDAKRQMTTAKSTLLPGFLAIDEFVLPLREPQTNEPARWEVDMRQGRNPNGGEGVCILRPRFDRWSFEVGMTIDTDQLDERVYRELVDIAGARIGLGDFRPQRKGIYGRFKVARWEHQSAKQAAE